MAKSVTIASYKWNGIGYHIIRKYPSFLRMDIISKRQLGKLGRRISVHEELLYGKRCVVAIQYNGT